MSIQLPVYGSIVSVCHFVLMQLNLFMRRILLIYNFNRLKQFVFFLLLKLLLFDFSLLEFSRTLFMIHLSILGRVRWEGDCFRRSKGSKQSWVTKHSSETLCYAKDNAIIIWDGDGRPFWSKTAFLEGKIIFEVKRYFRRETSFSKWNVILESKRHYRSVSTSSN